MTTTTFYRKANVSRADAAASLMARYPNADLVSFEAKKADADEARSAGVRVGEKVFAATIRTSEFPPSDDSSEESDDAPAEDTSSDSPPSDDESSSDAPDFGGSDDDSGLPEEKPLKGDDGIIQLLQQLLDVVKGGGSLGAPDDLGPDPLGGDPLGDPGMSGDPLGDPGAVPDIGAPGQGEGLPAPGAPPLPPPVKPKSPVGVGAFAHYNSKQAEITVVRQNTTGQIGNKEIIAEAREFYPTHTVAKIRRTGSAIVNGQDTNLPESKIAVVTLIAK